MSKKKYVIIHAYDPDQPDRVLLVKKEKPDWMCGCLNLVGGKVEKGEDQLKTAIRELKEETGLKVNPSSPLRRMKYRDVKLMGGIVTEDSIVYCVSMPVDSTVKLSPRKEEIEVVQWFDWETAKKDPRLMPNLRCIIPLMRHGVSGWFADSRPIAEGVYDVTIRFLLDAPVPYKSEVLSNGGSQS